MRNMYSQSTQVKFLRKPNMLPVLIASNPATDVKTIDPKTPIQKEETQGFSLRSYLWIIEFTATQMQESKMAIYPDKVDVLFSSASSFC